jgi:hypothetical protein
MTDPTPPTPRRRPGAPPGNKNGLKHGFYAHSFSKPENDRLNHGTLGEFVDEENFLRVLIDRTAMSMQDREMSHEELVVALRAICMAVGRIESLHRSRKVIYDKQTSLDQVLDELKYIPLDED